MKKITNYKIQITNKSQITISKITNIRGVLHAYFELSIANCQSSIVNETNPPIPQLPITSNRSDPSTYSPYSPHSPIFLGGPGGFRIKNSCLARVFFA